jgi:DnaJ-class molecular chaperone
MAAQSVLELRRFFGGGKEQNPYKTLGLKNGASAKEVKKAYRVLAKKLHPDAPGGDAERFQEVQKAYEQVKTGKWVPSTEGGKGGENNRYAGFSYTTNSHSKVSYDDFFKEMHTGKKVEMTEEEMADAAAAAKKKRGNPMGASEETVQAWFRLIFVWSTTFIVARVLLIAMFPPKREQHKKKQIKPIKTRDAL